jgi:hypothetical protein
MDEAILLHPFQKKGKRKRKGRYKKIPLGQMGCCVPAQRSRGLGSFE